MAIPVKSGIIDTSTRIGQIARRARQMEYLCYDLEDAGRASPDLWRESNWAYHYADIDDLARAEYHLSRAEAVITALA